MTDDEDSIRTAAGDEMAEALAANAEEQKKPKQTTVKLTWGDGVEHTFALPLIRMRELCAATESGPMELLRRLTIGTWKVDDVRSTIRLALIGGGEKPHVADRLVTNYVDAFPYAENLLLAQTVLSVALYGIEIQPEGQPRPAGDA